MSEELETAGRREPVDGWIAPSLADRVINDIRAGFAFEACARCDCDAETAMALAERAFANGFLIDDEAEFRGKRRAA